MTTNKENNMSDLEKYSRKKNAKVPMVIRSISINDRQKKFIEDNDLNLSKMTRDMLDSAMGEGKENVKKKKTR